MKSSLNFVRGSKDSRSFATGQDSSIYSSADFVRPEGIKIEINDDDVKKEGEIGKAAKGLGESMPVPGFAKGYFSNSEVAASGGDTDRLDP